MNQAVEPATLPSTSGLMPRHRRVLLTGASLVTLLGVGLFAGYWWQVGRFLEETDDAYVRADWVAVSPRIAGYVAQVLVEDNQPVKAGDILVRLDERDFIEQLRSTQARLLQARAAATARQSSLHTLDARLDEQQQRIAQAEAALHSSEAEAQRARLDFLRYRDLVDQQIATRERLETASAGQAKALAAVTQARAQVARQQAQCQVLQARRQQAQARIAESQARVGEAQANLALAQNALNDTAIRAPFDGVVGQRKVRRQQYVMPGLPLLAVVPVEQAYVIANYKETQLQHMAPGQSVDIAVDSFAGQRWRGEVESIAPGSGAVFALLPPDNATGNFTKVVQRFPVKIRLVEDEANAPAILPGMSVIATVDTRPASQQDSAHGG
ncbi:HlyD family efflux transporter periplasmic adaptor subunit [Pseudomonas gessardii]|uniref:HlyD family efflux transporter periplasmic adaptor subunit n=1 Tax=Pseudomonas gessardii TaxID=78544 RepID=A0ABS9F4U2_9PSED|nr:HlyD family secretion protein [Pseudomonas gessardii]MCF4979977.1 HlyD family efflux transporter periplasmic adaptor subunit [Pseudomonas gessardii]MCF4990412.1 HlyD family efflux transporter periplasmic adaptor subunit [Pseudomonas gessardii]MCF5087285.1 HlyD family efflux transporter periplasmic adaptor subunit [Pseudomonas gessardii]MCF5096808.1 HlyD family efflux transporter periplasmic adaptor subunit [Pseudomonas gessardii]MCF5107394.1 HlyD family efflux transporter periplasmic adapto